MRIYIATVSREAVPIDIPDVAKVSDLKKEISTKIPDVKLSNQILKFESKVLLDGNTMKQSGVTENSIIELLTLRKNSIFIKTANDGKITELEVDLAKSVDVLKKQITQLLNIPSECQRLFMTELKNKDILSSKIEPGATVNLCVIDLNLKLNIVHTKGTFPVEIIEIPKGYKISQLKDLIAVKWKIPAGHQSLSFNSQVLDSKKTLADYNIQTMSNINVKQINVDFFIDVSSLGRSKITCQALLTDTIDTVKKKIQKLLKIGAESQKLIWNGAVLNDRDSLISKGIVSGSTLSLIPIIQLFKINVVFDMLHVAIETHLNETIAELKQKIQLVTNISSVQQLLSLGAVELQNDKKLFDYGIKEGSSLVMARRDTFELCVETVTGFAVMVRVHKTDLVRFVKHQLAKLDPSLGVLAYEHALFFHGILLNDDATLSIYGIEPGSKLSMTLFVNNPYEDCIKIETSPMIKVLELKQLIKNQIDGLLGSGIVLKFQSKTLIDTDTLLSSGVQNNSLIDLTLDDCIQINVKAEDHTIYTVDVHYWHYVHLVKKMMNRLLKISVDEQQLFFKGKELINDDCLSHQHIDSGCTIELVENKPNIVEILDRRSNQTERIEISTNSTIAQLKQLLMPKYKVPVDSQTLSYKGQILNDNRHTLADYNIINLSKLEFYPNDISVFIQSTSIDRNHMTLRVSSFETIKEVKAKIETEWKINKSTQVLIWNGRALDDRVLLSDTGINDGSTLRLVVNVKILTLNIQLGPEDNISIDANLLESVAKLKNLVMIKTKIPIDQQTLFLDKRMLEDATILIDYNINETSKMVLERKDSFEIYITSFIYSRMTIRVHNSDSISHIKVQIGRLRNQKTESLRLLYGGKVLLDTDTLGKNNIGPHSTIHSVF